MPSRIAVVGLTIGVQVAMPGIRTLEGARAATVRVAFPLVQKPVKAVGHADQVLLVGRALIANAICVRFAE